MGTSVANLDPNAGKDYESDMEVSGEGWRRGRGWRPPTLVIRLRTGSPIYTFFISRRFLRKRSQAPRGQLPIMAFTFPDTTPDLLVSDHSAVLAELLRGQESVLFKSELPEVEPIGLYPV